MGYSRKDEIARKRRERSEAKAAKKRRENVRERRVRFLIVCEGTRTEPHYFKALIENHTSTVRDVSIEGVGRALKETIGCSSNMSVRNWPSGLPVSCGRCTAEQIMLRTNLECTKIDLLVEELEMPQGLLEG